MGMDLASHPQGLADAGPRSDLHMKSAHLHTRHLNNTCAARGGCLAHYNADTSAANEPPALCPTGGGVILGRVTSSSEFTPSYSLASCWAHFRLKHERLR